VTDLELRDRVTRAAEAIIALGAHEVYLFGSAVTGTMRPNSDIDLAVRGLPLERFIRAMGVAWDIVGRPVDLLDLGEDTPLTRYLERKGKLQRVG